MKTDNMTLPDVAVVSFYQRAEQAESTLVWIIDQIDAGNLDTKAIRDEIVLCLKFNRESYDKARELVLK